MSECPYCGRHSEEFGWKPRVQTDEKLPSSDDVKDPTHLADILRVCADLRLRNGELKEQLVLKEADLDKTERECMELDKDIHTLQCAVTSYREKITALEQQISEGRWSLCLEMPTDHKMQGMPIDLCKPSKYGWDRLETRYYTERSYSQEGWTHWRWWTPPNHFLLTRRRS